MRTFPPIEDRLFAKRRITESGCWEFTGYLNYAGYGQINYQGKMCRVNRVAYEVFVGPIPDGLVVDHVCRNRACFNPEHLDAITHLENVRRIPPFLHKGQKQNLRQYQNPIQGPRFCMECGEETKWVLVGRCARCHARQYRKAKKVVANLVNLAYSPEQRQPDQVG